MNLIDVAVNNSTYIFGEVKRLDEQEIVSPHVKYLMNAGYQMVNQWLRLRSMTSSINQPGVKLAMQ